MLNAIRTRSFAGSEITYTYAYDQNILGTGGQKVGGWTKVTSYTDGGRSASDSTDYFNHVSSHRDFGGHVVTYSYDYAAHLQHQASSAEQNIDFSYYVNGSIVLGATGTQISYDGAGLRTAALYADGHTECYSYTSDGYLADVRINGVLRSHRDNDALGRVQNYLEYAADGSSVTYSRLSVFDADSRVTQDTVTQSPIGGTSKTTITNYDYRLDVGGGHYTGADQGVVTHSFQYDPSKTAGGTGVDFTTSYLWWDEAKQSQIQVRGSDSDNANANAWEWGTGMSDFKYDVNGHLKQVSAHETNGKGNGITDNTPSRTLNYTSDEYGQVLHRDEL
ncbi:hypothetical protein [Paraherbaspirillum soli]|uniref:YD repeat-containing protein n=1 Tax=Paraherbaspirillum soli TaxID=631222 RepID=A0ABW0MDF9_9BURK